ncbi:hypothetical protein MOV66_30645 [Agrobacterium sp. SHOUNA12C]|uniref:Uncharacterized protein n=2 Tax=Rhizobium rhizogenes TaxID=359 RepID=B9JJ49_RHIR8|nr:MULTISPECIES: hypothetical protein [Rhizobium]ACM29941.1 hypothetical protein Arad_8741 [Rhizobium rhizogenes K84]MCJ9721391.1 hypothetical protein [Agrobacterium sp. BETTINA12B]MCJ9761032.1 hypothetical protein [Agrobacterium sp. SHOUNA12C]EJK86981.1 hypothetical protein PMI03_01465 [Rhizobium sp. AP16]MDJ1636669.1 hypothetical protein [Rhizobium rhizogenes]
MIRFEKKADPKPLPKDVEDKRPDKIHETAVEEPKKSGADGARSRARQPTEDDRLL